MACFKQVSNPQAPKRVMVWIKRDVQALTGLNYLAPRLSSSG
jgi:hypothetical protein